MNNKLKKLLKLGILTFGILLFITNCQKDEINKNSNEDVNQEIPLTHLKVSEVNINEEFEVSAYINNLTGLHLKTSKSSNKVNNSYLSTFAGAIPLTNAKKVIDSLGIINYTLPIHTEQYYSNRFYNLIIRQDQADIDSYVLEYEMDDTFAQSYRDGEVTIGEFKGSLKTYNAHDFFNNTSSNKSSTSKTSVNRSECEEEQVLTIFPCEETEIEPYFGSGSSGGGPTPWDDGSPPSGPGSGSGIPTGGGTLGGGGTIGLYVYVMGCSGSNGGVWHLGSSCGPGDYTNSLFVFTSNPTTFYNANKSATSKGGTSCSDGGSFAITPVPFSKLENTLGLNDSDTDCLNNDCELKNDIYQYLNQNIVYDGNIANEYESDALAFASASVSAICNSDSVNFEELLLTYTTLNDPTPWVAASGDFNNVPSLSYTHTRTIYVNGVPLQQYKLTNGDFISTGDYGIWQDTNYQVHYYSQDLGHWYQIPEPSTYNHLDLDFLWSGFWAGVQTGVRYCTPIEDIILLIDGEDFDGIAQSKATAGLFILVDLVPGGKVLKITKKAGYALSAASPVIKITIDAASKTQRNLRKQYKNIIETASNARKGNYGELCTDLDFVEKGYEVVHTRRVTTIDPVGDNTGIDHIFKNPETG